MWPSHGKTNRAGFGVTLRVQLEREHKTESVRQHRGFTDSAFASFAIKRFSSRASECTCHDQIRVIRRHEQPCVAPALWRSRDTRRTKGVRMPGVDQVAS